MPPALGVLELSLIARGMVVADALLKRAEVKILAARPVSGGKYLIWLRGGVAEVEESMAAGTAAAGEALVDGLEVPALDPQLWPFLPEPAVDPSWADDPEAEAVAIVEVTTVCAAIAAADAAVKAAEVMLRDMRLAVGIAGKAFFTMTGSLSDIEAAAEAASAAAADRALSVEVIAQPAPDLRGRLIT